MDRALERTAPTKAWVKDALRRRGAPRAPVRLKRLTYDVILRYGDALADLFSEYPDDAVFVQAYEPFIGYQPPERGDQVDPLRALTEDAEWTDEWGTREAEWALRRSGIRLRTGPRSIATFPAAASRYRRIFDEIHRVGLQVIFHSCGNVTEIVGDLIDLGVDVIDPLQPEAMDLGRIARDYGGKVAFSGGSSDQRIARAGPGEVRDEVRRTIEALFEACHEP